MQTVTVTRTETRQGKNGAYTIAHLEGGKRAYVWDKALAQSLAPGLYEAEMEERGGFLRLKSARPIASQNGAQGQEAHETIVSRGDGQQPVTATAQERLEALRLAMSAIGQVRPQDVGQVLEAARLILAYLREG